jgi:hypothetical protein
VTITLRVHPRYGQEVAVLRTHGPGALWVETADGEHTIMPAAWTDWRPRAALPELGGRMVLLVPEAMKELLLNYFRAQKEYSSGVVEGLNNKVRVVTRRSYGFRELSTLKIALFHTLGRLPEPELTHRFA